VTDRYPIPAATHRVEQTIRRSRFVATLGHAPDPAAAAAFVRGVGAEFPDATHNCWAFVAGAPGSTAQAGMSDAGETHGTAGRPMLTALLHGGVGEVVAVVSRWYGGVKLGTGGLVRAYGGAVQQALATLPLIEKVRLTVLIVSLDWAGHAALQSLLAASEAEVLSQSFDAGATVRIRLPVTREAGFRAALLDATRGRARFSAADVE
jgi:uncharacterized YigZ family protein